MRRIVVIMLLVAAATIVLAACGGGNDSDGMDMSGNSDMQGSSGMGSGSGEMERNRAVVPGAPEIPVRAGSLSFQPKRIDLRAGQPATLVLTSTDIAHDLYVKGVGHVVHAAAGKTARGGLAIDKPGTYQFWCTMRGHKQGGMTGTVTVSR